MLRSRSLRIAVLAGAVAGVVSAGAPAPASAATCSTANDSDIYGRGATFQNDAHKGTGAPATGGWIQDFPAWCSGKSLGAPGPVEYNRSNETETGSGGGLRSFGSVNGTLPSGSTGNLNDVDVRFAGTDEPPAGTTLTNIESGGREVRQFPVAQASITIPVNLPNGCTVASSLKDADGRVKITNQRVEQAFAGAAAADTWGELLDGSETSANVSCAATQVKRVVRSDVSGTTFQFRKYLQKYNASGTNWDSLGSGTTWPNEPDADLIKANGNGGVATGVSSNDGSLGYVVLSTARGAGFWYSGTSDDLYWIRLDQKQDSETTIRVDPADDAATATKNVSNCNEPGAARRFFDVPTGANPSDGDWTQASSIKPESGPEAENYYTENEYAICALTFVLAWKDYSTAYERGDNLYGTPTELAADTNNVKDYLEFILTPLPDTTGGQDTVNANDYAALPTQDVNTTDLRGDVTELAY